MIRRASAAGAGLRGLAVSLVVLGAVAGVQGLQAAERGPVVKRQSGPTSNEARVIVKFRSGTQLEQAQSVDGSWRPAHARPLGLRTGLALADGLALGSRSQVVQGKGMTSRELADKLAADSEVEYAVPDERVHVLAAPSDPLYPNGLTSATPAAGQWYLRAPSSTLVSAINAEGAWSSTLGSASVTVAVIDTGVRFDHPDLAGKLYDGYDFVSNTEIANDGDGRDSDASDPGDWITSSESTQQDGTFEGCHEASSSWHGTQTAGLVGAATDNGVGMASVGRKVMVLPVRAIGKCGGYSSDVIAAMRWAAGLSVSGVPANSHPARVINLSLGSTNSCSQAYKDALGTLAAAGVTVVASAGNDGLAVNSPANCPNVIAVGGVRHSGTKVTYSSVGAEVDISAPAGNCANLVGPCLYPILSTTNSGTTTPGAAAYTDGEDNPGLGTSFSAPLVAGTVSLMLSANSSLTPPEILAGLQSTARSFPSSGAGVGVGTCQAGTGVEQDECYCTTSTCGAGLLDAAAAVKAVLAPSPSIGFSPSGPTEGQSITLDAEGSTVAGGRSIAGYAWALTSGIDIASFSGSTDGSTATLVTSGAGSVVVRLTITDSSGATASTSRTISVAAATSGEDEQSMASSSSTSGGGGGGGGAAGLGELVLYSLVAIALGASRRRRHR